MDGQEETMKTILVLAEQHVKKVSFLVNPNEARLLYMKIKDATAAMSEHI